MNRGKQLSSGQRAVLEGEYDTMLACVRCGLCLTSCPTYVLTLHEAESPRGRIAMMRALTEGTLPLSDDLLAHQSSCLVCDACSAVCPAGVRMDPLQSAFRAAAASTPATPRALVERLLRRLVFRHILADMRLLRLLVRLLGLYQRLGARRLARRVGLLRLPRLDAADALLPPIPRRFVVPGESNTTRATRTEEERPLVGHGEAERVHLFAGCIMSTMLAEIDRATMRVLQRAGCAVEVTRGQGCCGALHAHGGDLEGAKTLAKRNIAAFEDADAEGAAPIIVNSAGCGAMLKDYAHHLRGDPMWAARAEAFSSRALDVTRFLAARSEHLRLAVARREAAGPAPSRVATYQDACHLLHAQGIAQEPRAVLRALPGVELREMADRGLCCGSAGIYNLTHPETARALRERKLDQALATGADVIVTTNPGCLLHLRAGLAERGSPVQVKHIVELLDDATAGAHGG